MSTKEGVELPLIDLSGYLTSTSPTVRDKVIRDVADACQVYGFFQVKGHGIPLETQRGLLQSLENVFNVREEVKLERSFLKNPCHRGYEASGMTLRDGDVVADSKECYYVGPEDPVVELSGFYGPNVWPDLPDEKFRGPVWEHYQKFAQRSLASMKMIRYPPASATLLGQHGAGVHTDFAGLTILLQEPNKRGLEVWHGQEWVPVPAQEDVYVVNVEDMTQRWSGGRYKSAQHRVVNRAAESTRLSCATFWQGDVFATNPMIPDDLDKETIGQGLVRRFRRQYTLDHVVDEVDTKPYDAAIDEVEVGPHGQLVTGGCTVS